MPGALQQLRDFTQGEVFGNGPHHLARLRHLQTEELIALTILTWSCLEEPHEDLSLRIILLRLHISDDFLCCDHFDGKGTKKIGKYKTECY